ncbi:MAG: polysaccharide pyruvyl transferase family protein [Bacteroidales bacterium]|nr:polysaccharide pyruvyl transferase family protein [Bacteroidales bacterium]MBP5725003.1 polysaccharide pyruvyl transferase family protein [Bacteroidales bacterium]
MKKIGILTFHAAQNYGASLQCYALLTTLTEIGIDAEIINYLPVRRWSRFGKWSRFITPAYIVRLLYNIPYMHQLLQMSSAYRLFSSKYYIIEPSYTLNDNTISEASQKYEAIFFGSDQIWNLGEKMYDRSEIFFGTFEYSGLKFSYAASFGDEIKELETYHSDFIKKYLSRFSQLSVREQSGKELLLRLGINSTITIDPTMLLSKEKWSKLAGETPLIQGEYILYYSVNGRGYSRKFAQKLSKQTGLKVINIVPHPKTFGAGFENHYNFGPLEFLNCIKFAKYTVVNSFHGTVFSILFEKSFYSVFPDIEGEIQLDARRYTLLSSLSLEDNMVTQNSEIKFNAIDYANVQQRLKQQVNESIEYIRQCIEMLENNDKY